mgnify:CR=1 FL=1
MLEPALIEGMFGERLTLGEVLGEGATSIVYSAQRKNGEQVVVKVFLRSFDGEERMMRFERECKSLSRLSHRNIIKLLRWSVRDGVPALLFPFVEGMSLEQLLVEKGPMKPEKVCQIGHKLALALAHCHELDILHRDIKPANVFIGRDGEPMLIDFGLASSQLMNTVKTKTGVVLGTPVFMAPEVISGEKSSISSELYSLGILFCQMLAGRDPFPKKLPELFTAKLAGSLPKVLEFAPQTPSALVKLIDGLLLSAKKRKPRDAKELADRLALVDQKSTATQLLQAPPSKNKKSSRRFHLLFTILLLGLFTLLLHSHTQKMTIKKVNRSAADLYELGKVRLKEGKEAEAFTFFKRAARHSHRQAVYETGKALVQGRGCEKDVAKGLLHLKQAVKWKIPEAIYDFAELKYLGKDGPRDYRKIYELFSEAAKLGHLEALFMRGLMNNRALGTKRNLAEAYRCYVRAYEMGSIRAGVEYASYVRNEQAKPVLTSEELIALLEKGTAIGYANAFRQLGHVYKAGRRVPKDLVLSNRYHRQAFVIFEKEHLAGDPQATYTLYVCCFNGEGVPHDVEKAVTYLHKAAERDYPDAFVRLGDALREGNRGMTIDYERAEAYYKRAIALGREGVQAKLHLLYIAMKKDRR